MHLKPLFCLIFFAYEVKLEDMDKKIHFFLSRKEEKEYFHFPVTYHMYQCPRGGCDGDKGRF